MSDDNTNDHTNVQPPNNFLMVESVEIGRDKDLYNRFVVRKITLQSSTHVQPGYLANFIRDLERGLNKRD